MGTKKLITYNFALRTHNLYSEIYLTLFPNILRWSLFIGFLKTASSLTIANTGYVLLRQMGSNKAKSILRKLRLIVKTLSLDDKIVGLALNDDSFLDFEDGLQYFTALENVLYLIITRNLKDFKKSKLPVMTARQFIETI